MMNVGCAFNEIKIMEADPRVEWGWVPNTFPSPYLNFGHVLWQQISHSTKGANIWLLMPIFANSYPKAHTEENPMKSKAQRPAKKTKEQERSKERSARERDLQQNTNLPQSTVLWQNGFGRQRQIGPKILLIQSTLFGPQRPKSFCIKNRRQN